MSLVSEGRSLSARDVEPILAVAAKLAAPFDLTTMLTEVVEAARSVLTAERATVWLYDRDRDELVLRLAMDIKDKRIPAGTGLVGACARSRRIINVHDCYADPRFDQSMDRLSGFRTRCMLTLPMVDHNEVLVGVMQVLNKAGGTFDESDERLSAVLAAQCAVALQRVRMTEAIIEGEKMRQELELAREVQMSTLPATMPAVPGYDVHGTFRPADLTGGDTFDLARVGDRLLVVLGDATGHGIGPALSVTQMQAMLRMAFRLGADLETAFVQVNNQLAETLPGDRFITAFVGLLDPATHRIEFHSGGQGPILHLDGASGACTHHMPTSFPLAAMAVERMHAAVTLELHPGDLLALISDGIFEYRDDTGEEFGEARVREVLATHRHEAAVQISEAIFAAVKEFAGHAPQEDDMTVVLVKRDERAVSAAAAFRRSFDAIEEIFAFTSSAFAREGIEPEIRSAVDLVLEEIFTNVVKYGRASPTPVRVELTKVLGGVEVTLVEDDAERFDLTRLPEVDTTLPLEQRSPGGLGLHLVRKIVDSLEYRYDDRRRQARITFRKTMGQR
ncbi:MAG: SpoIIE family protein phosphatase [Usitatibacter sp.]